MKGGDVSFVGGEGVALGRGIFSWEGGAQDGLALALEESLDFDEAGGLVPASMDEDDEWEGGRGCHGW
jgi:hypothetical protein